jgi:hypothetical protein
MGLDLRLLPFDADFFSHTILDCERRSDLFEAVLKVEGKIGRDVPDNFQSFTGKSADASPCYGKTIRTPYGENLKYMLAGDLVKFAKHVDVTDNEKNRAIWAYLTELNPSNKVALFWH